MRMVRIKANKIYIMVLLLLLLQVKLFYLIPVSTFYNVNSNQQQILMVLIVFFTWTLYKFKMPKLGKKSCSFFVGLFIVYYFFELLISALKNGQGLVDVFIASNFYLMILFYFILLIYFRKQSQEDFYNIVVKISALNILLCWLQYILAYRGIYFMRINTNNIRFNSIRISDMGETMTCLGIIICIAYFLNCSYRKKWFYFTVALLGLMGNLIVSKGRITLLALFVSACVICISKFRKNLVKVFSVILLVVIAVFIFSQTPMGQIYINSLSDVETDTGSVRRRELEYYNAQTTENIVNFVTGVGFIRDNGDEMSNYLKGPSHQYSRTDIGIWGLANAIGIIGVIWYTLVNLNMIIKIRRISKMGKNTNYLIALGLMTFSIVYIPTMIMINPYSITVFAILMALVDREYYKEYFPGVKEVENDKNN